MVEQKNILYNMIEVYTSKKPSKSLQFLGLLHSLIRLKKILKVFKDLIVNDTYW